MDVVPKREFEIGQRVIGVGEMDGLDLSGHYGTIVGYLSDFEQYSVEWDEPFYSGLHNCGGMAKEKHGWNCRPRTIEPIEEGPAWDLGCIDELIGVCEGVTA